MYHGYKEIREYGEQSFWEGLTLENKDRYIKDYFQKWIKNPQCIRPKEFKKQSNVRIVGNPVREEFLTQNRIAARKKLRLGEKDFFILEKEINFAFLSSSAILSIISNVLSLLPSFINKTSNL